MPVIDLLHGKSRLITHLLGLGHGGANSINNKPHYISIMNYSFAQNGGLIINQKSGFLDYSRFSSEALPNLNEDDLDETIGIGLSGYGTHYFVDFDSEKLCNNPEQPLQNLWGNASTPVTILDASGTIDWDDDGLTEASVSANINGDIQGQGSLPIGAFPLQEYSVLRIQNDWRNIQYGLSGTTLGTSGGGLQGTGFIGEPAADQPSFTPYAVKFSPEQQIITQLGITQTIPITLTNTGLTTTTVVITPTATNNWLDVTAIPVTATLVPSQSLMFPITLTVPHTTSNGTETQLNLIATPNEAPRMKDMTTVAVQTTPIAWFEATPIKGYAPLTVTFTNLSFADSWLWDFGDDITSTLQNPTHIYALTGVYLVQLLVENGVGTDIYSATIQVQSPPIVHATPFTDDLASPQQNWHPLNGWITSTNAHSPDTAWQGILGNSALILADQLDLTSAFSPTLFFWQQFTSITGTGQVMITLDNGTSWQPVLTTTAPITHWQEAVVDLRPYAGEHIGLAFALNEVISPTIHTGWYVDDMLLVPNCDPAVAPTDVQISQTGNHIQLSWTHHPNNRRGYEIWHSKSPYFEPGDANSALLARSNDSNYTHQNATGEISENHFYVVRGINACDYKSGVSNRTGEFDFVIEVP